MKLAILGGSFNPVHIGHLYLADAVLAGFNYDRVILVPAFQSPFKIGAGGASPKDRMEMLISSIAGDPRLAVDDCEISREGVSYTVDTIGDIIARYRPEGKPGLIMGDDLASTFYKWRSPEKIAELADIIIARRLTETTPGLSGDGYPCAGRESNDADAANTGTGGFPYPFKALDNDILNVSSRLVREKICRREDWRYLVPPAARCIIEDRGLFKPALHEPAGAEAENPEPKKNGMLETIVRIENDVRRNLDSRRFRHSRGTALMVWDLCRRFGLDCQKGYLAGIAHDYCKDYSDKDLFRLAKSDGAAISRIEQGKPGLLHARAAAVWLQKKYGIEDRDILDAIRYHTTGKPEMNALARVVYIADKIEVSRPNVDPILREMSRYADLDILFMAVLDNTVAYLKSRQLDISYGTKRLLAAMQKRN